MVTYKIKFNTNASYNFTEKDSVKVGFLGIL